MHAPSISGPADPPDTAAAAEAHAPGCRRWGLPSRPDVLAVASYVAGAVYVFAHLWPRMTGYRLRWAANDQTVFEWMYAHTAHAIAHGSNPFVTTAMNMPDGVNLLANTAMLALGVLFAPITLAFGAPVTFAVVQAFCLASTATGWYVLWRRVVASPAAAWVGGVFCGFAPPLVAQANGHTNVIAQGLVPLLVWWSLRLSTSTRPWRHGALLGGAIAVQFFVGPELLFDTALGLALYVTVYAARRPELRARWRPLARGLGVAAAVAFVVLACPMYLQFFGPQSYRGIFLVPWRGNDLTKLVTLPGDSLFGDRAKAYRYVLNPVEQNANFGWPLLAVVAAIVVVLRRDRLVRTAALCALVFVWLSLGDTMLFRFTDTGVPTPWKWLRRLPLFDSLLPSRIAMIAVPFLGLVLAVGVDRALAARRAARAADPATDGAVDRAGARAARRRAAVGLAAVALALVPLTPRPLQVAPRPAAPRFITDGTWERYVRPGRGLVFAPPADPDHTEPMVWQAATGMAFTMPGGYFLAPVGPDRLGKWPADGRPTSALLFSIAYHGGDPEITDRNRLDATADLAAWQADAVVLTEDQAKHDELLSALWSLLGEPQRVDDVWLWDVRNGPALVPCGEDDACRRSMPSWPG